MVAPSLFAAAQQLPGPSIEPVDLTTWVSAGCDGESSAACQWVGEITRSSAAARVTEWVWSYPLRIVFILACAFVVNRIVRYLIKRSMLRVLEPQSERTVRARRALQRAAPAALLRTSAINLRTEARVHTITTVLRSIASVIIWFTAVLACLQVLAINVASLVAVSSIAGVALGFGAQNIVRDFLAGTFIVLEDQFGVGDTVDLGNDAKGTVEELTLRATKVRDVNGTVWHVPNGQILRVANKSQEWARAVLDIEVDGGTDYERAAAIIHPVAVAMAAEEQWAHDIVEPPQVWGVESFTEKGYTVRLVLKTRPGSQFGVMRELRIRLLAAFGANGIVLPGGQWAFEHPPKKSKAKEAEASVAVAAAAPDDPTAPHPQRGAPGEAG